MSAIILFTFLLCCSAFLVRLYSFQTEETKRVCKKNKCNNCLSLTSSTLAETEACCVNVIQAPAVLLVESVSERQHRLQCVSNVARHANVLSRSRFEIIKSPLGQIDFVHVQGPFPRDVGTCVCRTFLEDGAYGSYENKHVCH